MSAKAGLGLPILGVRFGDHGATTRVVIDAGDLPQHKAFVLQDPNRLVVDLAQSDWRGAAEVGPGAGLVQRYRLGNYNEQTLRIVFDLSQPSKVVNIQPLPAAMGKAARLVVDLAPHSSPIEAFPMAPDPAVPPTMASTASQGANQTESAAGASVTGVVTSVGQMDGFNAEDDPIGALLAAAGIADYGAAQDPLSASASATSSNVTADGTPVPSPKPPLITRPVVVLDPGHGGVDPGAISAEGVFEKNVVLAIARRVRDHLEASGRYKVVMTRNSDVYIKLRERVEIARRAGADLFISIHADSIDRTSVRGASIYTVSETASDKEAAKLAARENRSDIIAGVNLDTERDEVASILIDLAMRDTKNQSKRFAGYLVQNFSDGQVTLLTRPHRYAGFAVLKAPDVPSVLIESGYMSNVLESRQLTRREHQDRIAGSIHAAIDAYFDRLEVANQL